jgi:hypothetical protein
VDTSRIRRPRIVIAAAVLLACGGALVLAEAASAARTYLDGPALHDHTLAGDMGVAMTYVVAAAFGAGFGTGLLFSALFTALGRNWARTAGWCLGFPVLLFYGFRTVFNAVTGFWTELDRLDVTLMIAIPVLLVAALVCQTAPRADAWFRPAASSSDPAVVPGLHPDGHPPG